MGSVPVLASLLACEALAPFTAPAEAFDKREEIKAILALHLQTGTTAKWLAILEPADIWCADVLNWKQLMAHEGFKALNMIQEVEMNDGYTYRTTRCPIRMDGELLVSAKGSPKLGQDNEQIINQFINVNSGIHEK
ncbi:formyl-coenzyme A transferase [compost metagenome]